MRERGTAVWCLLDVLDGLAAPLTHATVLTDGVELQGQQLMRKSSATTQESLWEVRVC
jgi:hypothetical protein